MSPPINAASRPLVAIAVNDVSIALNVDALDNDFNIFYSKDFSSKLVTTRIDGGNLSHKAFPVCFLASSISVDVLDLMHERTGHFYKRGLIECVKSKIFNELKIEDKDTFGSSKILINTSVTSVPERKLQENILRRSTKSNASYSEIIFLLTLHCS